MIDLGAGSAAAPRAARAPLDTNPVETGTVDTDSVDTDAAGSAVGVFNVEDAIEVADRLMAADDLTASTAGNVEPDSPRAAQIAVEHLDRRLRGLPFFIRKGLAGAERSADRLSDDRLQGLAELILDPPRR